MAARSSCRLTPPTASSFHLICHLRSLGRFRVRDFDDPVELWQVHGEGLDDDVPGTAGVAR